MAKTKPIEIDILDMEMSQGLPYWLDPVVKYSGMHDADRRQAQIDRSDAIQEQARKQRRTKQWQRAKTRAQRLLGRTFDPSEPRDDQGQWTSGGGGDDDAPVAFVSPNVGNLNFNEAHAGLNSARQQALRKASADVDSQLGKTPVEATNVVGAWSDGAENSLMLTLPKDWTHQQSRVALAMKGWLGDQKSALLFTPDKGGNAFVASMPMTGKLDDIHRQLLDDGLAFHTLEPTSDGAVVHVYGDDQATADAVDKAAGKHDTQAQFTFGHGEFIGTTKQDGTDREQRDDARRAYEAIIADPQAGSAFDGRDVGAIWQGLRARWGGELSPQEVAVPDYQPGVRGRGRVEIENKRADWVAASPIKTIDHVKAAAPIAQRNFAEAGRRIAKEMGIEFKDPGAKTSTAKGIARTEQKIAERKGVAARVTDTARGAFILDKPEQADAVIAKLARTHEILAEPWRTIPETYYTDRALLFRDRQTGLIGEVQITEPKMAAAKKIGHPLYEQSRSLPAMIDGKPNPQVAELEAKQRAVYGPVLDSYKGTPWAIVDGRSRS